MEKAEKSNLNKPKPTPGHCNFNNIVFIVINNHEVIIGSCFGIL